MVVALSDPRRIDPPHVAEERAMLEAWLEWHRWNTDVVTWQTACEASRAAAAEYGLDDTGLRRDEEVSLRWIYLHMIEEYARHNGHADLIREMIDGAVGD